MITWLSQGLIRVVCLVRLCNAGRLCGLIRFDISLYGSLLHWLGRLLVLWRKFPATVLTQSDTAKPHRLCFSDSLAHRIR